MNSQHHPLNPAPIAAEYRSILLYEDTSIADAGAEFALLLSTEVGLDIGCPERHWWLEMLEVPRIADEAHRQALASSHVILSLRGDRDLSRPNKEWIEEWLTNPHSESVALMVLFDSERSQPRVVSRVRRWLEQLASDTSVNVFSFGAEASPSAEVLQRTEQESSPTADQDGAEWFIGAMNLCGVSEGVYALQGVA